ncbi:uncharacterized protein B0I36DRAFT_335351 [Microdochium trichocladiopsis]|uniref:Tat pathway signal sequence n=1 Tax=Microdochium trichocladiopsis TaxID=1682393 RepID=A0A9P8XU32_9PEZI|nr:uncharacterized protein B0I36DRAFT_335351 [Microdochium trichocladiopsis]KAH7018128.1 hypothetical protein B0I36DRAFT_335351 [Microdochium trichocladiopsis]
MAEKSEEYAPLYDPRSSGEKSESDYDDVEMKALGQRGRRHSRWRRARPWALHLGLPMLYTGIFLGSMYARPLTGTFSMVDSPAKYIGENTHLEVFPLAGPPKGIYTGEPREELDEAWRTLLQYNNIRISDEWIHKYGREDTAVKLPDGGYLGMLSAFHEVHCVKRLYQTLHRDHYFPNATAEELDVNLEHDMHCLEVLRMSAMCRGDVSLINHRWKEDSPYPNVDQRAPHQCVDWDAVMDYSASMAVDVYQEHYIVNPKTGVEPFPHGKSIKPFKEQDPDNHNHHEGGSGMEEENMGASTSHMDHEHMHEGSM